MTEFQKKLRVLEFIPSSFTKKELFKILNKIPVPLAMVGANQDIIFTNQQLLSLGGFSNLKGQTCKNSFCNNISCTCLALANGTANKIKTGFVKNDGTLAIVNKIAHKLEFNNTEYTLIFFIDITEEEALKKYQDIIIKEKSIAENNARNETEKFEFLFENFGEALYLLNGSGDFVKVNKKALKHLGYTKEELASMTVFDVKQSQSISKISKLIETIKKEGSLLFETNHITKTGKLKIVEIASSHFTINDDDHFLCSIRDITARKKMERDLIISKEKAQESEKMKSAFLNNVSHQIRTPLNGILGFVDILENDFSNLTQEERRKYFNIIRESSNKLLNTVEDIIDVSKLNSGTVRLKSETFSLKDDLQALIQEVEQRHQANNNTFYFEIDPDIENISIKTDKHMLMRVIKSLIDNVFKFNSNNHLKLIVHKKEDCILFSVEDNGDGIPEGYIDKIFDPFTQTDHSLKKAINGNGLGLTISKKLVNYLGGQLKAENLAENGSRFYFTIPYKRVGAPENTANFGTAKNPLNGKTLLIAEDDLITFMLLKNKLKAEGCNIIHALNGQEAIEHFKTNKLIDLIIMDVNMPVMDGLEATEIIRKHCKKIPILAHSAFVHDECNNNYAKYGFNDFLNKPTDKNLLLKKLNACIKN